MEGLDLDNILDEDAMSLFNDDGTQEDTTPEDTPDNTGDNEQKEKKNTTEDSPEGMFGEPESVGSEDKNNEGQEDTLTDDGDGTSPKTDFFSSIAEAFAEEGILPNLDDETIKKIKTPEDFRKAIDDYIKSELDEQQQRVKEALDNNIEVDTIRQYEGVLNYLDSIKAEDLKAEGKQGEELRQRLIFQDYINRGFDKSRAEREVKRAMKNGTDIEDAIEALNSCKDFYQDSYNDLLEEAKKARLEEEDERKKRAENLKKTIFDEKSKFFGDIELDQATRQKVFDNLSKPIYKDPKSGEAFTAIQRFEMEHSDEFLVKLSLLFTLTDNFKSLDKLVASKVKKGIKRGLKDLEGRINSTSRDANGNLRYTSGVDDTESYLGKGIKLAI